MTAAAVAPHAPEAREWPLPPRGTVGMLFFIAAESSIFALFVVAYLYYMGRDTGGPTPQEVLRPPLLISAMLLSSSGTITAAERALKRGNVRAFGGWWLATILLGAAFLVGTALEWRELITEHHLTIRTNLFGTTFYSLVGLHATHVLIGLIALTVVMLLTAAGKVRQEHAWRTVVLGLYWHFVDVVWVVVFTVVYVIGR
jgi:cytochrome c oxidase subunit III